MKTIQSWYFAMVLLLVGQFILIGAAAGPPSEAQPIEGAGSESAAATEDEGGVRNVEIAEVGVAPRVMVGDFFEVHVVVRGQGVAGETIRLELLESQETGEEKIMDRRELTWEKELSETRVRFRLTAEEVGRKVFKVSAVALEGETNLKDNTRQTETRILNSTTRVLLVASRPTWDFRAVSQLLTRNRSVDLSCWLQDNRAGEKQKGNTELEAFPATREELFKFDAVLLFDPDPADLDPEWVEHLRSFVREQGGGCLFQAGPVFSDKLADDKRLRGLSELLPVELVPWGNGPLGVRFDKEEAKEEWALGPVLKHVEHPLLQIADATEDRVALWRGMPGIYWSFSAKGTNPGAAILLEHTDPKLNDRPLLATHDSGEGRVIYQGFNSTWRWRRLGEDAEYFNSYWLQMLKYMTGRR